MSLPRSFDFPYEPYEIQNQFMTALYSVLQDKKVGIFESPTGTGKSLSLICGSLSWLLDHIQEEKEELKKIIEKKSQIDDNEVNWFDSATERIEGEKEKKQAKQKLDKIEKQERKIRNIRTNKNNDKVFPEQAVNKELDELFRDLNEVRKNIKQELEAQTTDSEISPLENEFILDQDISFEDEESKEYHEKEEDILLKIYYCSRTHSQLSQFLKEIKKTRFKDVKERKCEEDENKSKKMKKEKGASRCPFYKLKNIEDVSKQVLSEVQDLEQLVSASRNLKGCPYYGTRHSIIDAQLVILPYQTLLHKGTRASYNIKLKDNIAIIDEAHNLLETISDIHSALLFYGQICGAHSQLSQYLHRYEKRLSPHNLLSIRQILFVVKALMKLLSQGDVAAGHCFHALETQTITLHQFLHETHIDNLNIFSLLQYMEKSKLPNKLHGFCKMLRGQIHTSPTSSTPSTSSFLTQLTSKASKVVQVSDTEENVQHSDQGEKLEVVGNPIVDVINFMKAILYDDSDGRVLVHKDKVVKKSFIKFLTLNPAAHFCDIVQQCRSIIIAGGTMSPMDEFKDQLFLPAGASPDRIVEFSCSHVVPQENILSLVLKQGPGGKNLDFSFKNRSDTKLIDELGRILLNISNIVYGGIVVFFPSYECAAVMSQYLQQSGIIDKLCLRKQIFQEPKKSSLLSQTLNDYSCVVNSCCEQLRNNGKATLNGAFIFSVVGGKLSEGINFSDNLGRCVIMVGMPYANFTSCQLKEKMTYLEQHYPPQEDGKTAGAVFYENLCYKSVNQCIGRSIRHREDYASILLLDARYAQTHVLAALPKWISSCTKVCNSFGPAFGFLRNFFASKKASKRL